MRFFQVLLFSLLAAGASAQIGPAWRPFLEIKDGHARFQVVTALSSDWNVNSSKIIIAALMDPSPEVVGCARETLKKHKSRRLFNQLIAGMQEGSQYEAALLLGDYKERRYIRAMIRQLRNPSVNIRRPIALALGIIHDPAAYKPLQQALRDPEPNFHGEVERALARYTVLAPAGPQSASLHFTRREQKVFVPYQKPLDVVGELTMEAWVFPERDPKVRRYHWVLSRNYAPGGYGLVLEGRDTRVIGGTHETVPFDAWSHIAVVLSKRAEKVYVNGELGFVATGDHRVKPRPTLPMYIGNSNFGGSESTEFTGRIAEIRVWDVGRGQDQIRRDMHRFLRGNERGLVAYFPLCEGVGFSAHDFTSHLMAGSLGDSYRANANAPEWDKGPPVTGRKPRLPKNP